MSEDLHSLALRFYECFKEDALHRLLADDEVLSMLDSTIVEFGHFRRGQAYGSREEVFEQFCADLECSGSQLLADLRDAAVELEQAQMILSLNGMSYRERDDVQLCRTLVGDFVTGDADTSVVSTISTSLSASFAPTTSARAVSANLRRRSEYDAAKVRSDLESRILLKQLEQLRGRIRDSRAKQRENAGELRALQRNVIVLSKEKTARQYGEEDALCDNYRARIAQLNDQFAAFRAELKHIAGQLRNDGIANVRLTGKPIHDARNLIFALINHSESESIDLATGSRIQVQYQSIARADRARRIALENQALRYKIQGLRDRLSRLQQAAGYK